MFMERALPTALVPNRDVGVQVLGEVAGGTVSYMAGVMNGVADGASADVDTNDGKDVSGRLVFRPFLRHEASFLRGLGLGVSGSTGSAGSLPALRTQILQQPYFSYSSSSSTPVVADGTRTRYSPQVWYFHKAFGGWGEYVRTETPLHSNAAAAEIAHTAWQVAGTWMLTGENATDAAAGVKPHANFDLANGNWGAFQIAARYHVLEVDGRAISLNFATPGSAPKAEAWTVGLRWYLTRNFSYTVNLERTVFDGNPDARRNAENALAFRTQVSF
jgi:phosphate-selective porin OprO/OprP